MLNRLFKAKWQHPNAETRLQALNELSWEREADQTVILSLAAKDEDERVRHSAVTRIAEQNALQRLLNESLTALDWIFIAGHLAAQFPASLQAVASALRIKIESWDDATRKQAIGGLSNTELLNLLVRDIQDPELLAEFVVECKINSVRMLAVEKIEDISLLQQLLKNVSHKSLVQTVRAKIKLHKAQQLEHAAIVEQADKLLSAMQKLARLPWEPQFEYKLAANLDKWKHLDPDILGERVVEYDKAVSTCQQTLEEYQHSQLEKQQQQAVHDKQQMLLEQLIRLASEITNDHHSSHHALRDAVNLIDKNWMQIEQEAFASANLNAQYSELKFQILEHFKRWDKFEQLIPAYYDLFEHQELQGHAQLQHWCRQWESLSDKLNWPKNIASPLLLVDWSAKAQSIFQTHQNVIDKQKNKASNILNKLKLLHKHINDKNLIAANKLMNFIEHKIADIQEDYLVTIQPKLEKILPQLEELRDWHAFATLPKKESLCQAMEALPLDKLNPLQRAEAVKSLQHQWHELIASDSKADDQMWERFKQASEIAFQPCLEYYAEQDKVKTANLEKRLQLCEKLEQHVANIDWQTVDWKVLDKLQNATIAEWQNYAPVPDKEHKSAKKRFDKINNTIRQHLKQEKQRNLELRIELVERAKKLVEMEELDRAIQISIDLQQQWKSIGVTFFKAEKQQWNQFRKAIDKVFARREQAKQHFVEELAANEQKLINLTEQIKTLSMLDDLPLRNSFEEFEQLVSSWDGSLTLPRASAKKRLDQFYSCCDHYRQQYSGIDSRQKKQSLNALKSLLESLHEAEIQLSENQLSENQLSENQLVDISTLNIALQDIEFQADLKDFSFKDGLQKRIQSIENLQHSSDAKSQIVENFQSNQEEARTLVLQAEILAGIESPEQYKQQRMTLQLQQLEQGLTAQLTKPEVEHKVMALFQHWTTLSFIPKAEYRQLNSRMDVVFQKVAVFS